MEYSTDRVLLEAIPQSKQKATWQDALASHGYICRLHSKMPLHTGEIISRKSPTDFQVTLLRSAAQKISCNGKMTSPTGSEQIAVVFHVRGCGNIESRQSACDFFDGNISVHDKMSAWELDFHDDFEILLIELPREHLLKRLGLHRIKLPIVLDATYVASALTSLLQTVADNMETMGPADLPALEVTTIELTTSALLYEAKTQYEALTQVQAALMRRVCATIETRLSDRDLSISDIAHAESLSQRYLQRLFKTQETTFSHYLRQRRLERCRIDLMDPNRVGQNTTDIAYNWGFRDGATFSRSFKSAYGLSPTAMRNKLPSSPEPTLNRGRPIGQSKIQALQVDLTFNTVEKVVEVDRFLQGTQNPSSLKESDTYPLNEPQRHYLSATKDTVHWGYLGNTIPPKLYVEQDSLITIETLTQHAFDDFERMIEGDVGAESVFHWARESKAVERRGAGPVDSSIIGRGAGEGFGVHICTGPVYVNGAEPGDVLEVQILDLYPRPCANPKFTGKAYGSNVAAWWGFQYNDEIDGAGKREVVTIYETDLASGAEFAQAVYSYRWTPQTDPYGVIHETIDYPGIPVNHETIEKKPASGRTHIPARLNFGFMGVAPREAGIVDSIPPSYFGGNIDNWRMTKGSTLYLPVAVPGALFSIGDPHYAQGDGEICGTALELSLTGDFRLILHKRGQSKKSFLEGLSFPLLENQQEWILHGFSYSNHLRDLGQNAQSDIYSKSSVDLALRNAFRATRKFLMEKYQLDEDEAVSVMSLAVDFGVTQVADGNWGVHALVDKNLFK